MKETDRQDFLRTDLWLSMAMMGAFLVLWEWLVLAGIIPALFFPAPSTILLTLFHLIGDGELAVHTGATLSRVALGLALGGIPGTLLGFMMGWSRRLRSVIDPWVAAVHPIPKIAILPLIMIVFGIGESSIVIVIAISAFFPMLINTMAGVRQISPIHFEVAQNYGASAIQIILRVIIPGSLPMVLVGARLALNTTLLITIAVELVTAQNGLGAMIWWAWQTLRVEQIYSSLFVVALLGILFNGLLQRLGQWLVPWETLQELE
jgi:ABC-type nitrate/sulfonate/bicarbonate transport system permease component